MTGWLIFFILALIVLVPMLWPMRLGRPLLMLIGAALFVAAAGYAWQGSPGQPGALPAERDMARRPDGIFQVERQRFLNRYGETGQMLATADSFNKLGLDEAAAGLLHNAVAKHPKDADLRIGYAHALLVQAGGNFSPAVQLAFDRAVAAAPSSPAPRYFLGLAHLESGDPPGAERIWRDLYASLPTASPGRRRWRSACPCSI